VETFAAIEATPLSVWIRETPSILGFQAILTLHTLGMAFLAGIAALIDLRILGAARAVPLAPLRRFLPIAWTALALSTVSGVLLLIGYPTKALTNPLFYLKLALVSLGLFTLVRIRRTVLVDNPAPAKALAIFSLAAWAGVIAGGRFLAYTYTHLTAS
jgi:hypothetical protein